MTVPKFTIALEPELWYNLDRRLGRDAFIWLCVVF
jgi:hypothetical protein